MAVVRVDALCECEGCQKRFGVELDLASNFDVASDFGDHLDFEQLVRDILLGTNMMAYTWGVRGRETVDRLELDYWPSIQGGMMLCDECSRKCDSLPGDGDLSREEVERVLGGEHG